MLPAPPNFSTAGSQFALQNNFTAGPSYGPQPQQAYLPQPLQDPLHQGADPNSPEVFKNNISVVHGEVMQLQLYARRALLAIQNAYQPGNSPAQTEEYIAELKQKLATVIEKLRQSGVGALPVIPTPADPSAAPVVPSESQLLVSTTASLRALYEKLQRSQDSASVVANLLTTDYQPKAGK
ncbi:hypothetical protein GALMADRAFT_898876 [Galerina marginata CBS 339.88]|uniref:Uncharacterized protein n=1 Tax=Galerina marginata (strain CBS 339.88) TaxID=685588 RepID=A0A067SQN2_GALM3|nr:hypothetical protein GALMADRAFT_898876 [Galerina marginata CBS 339.88]